MSIGYQNLSGGGGASSGVMSGLQEVTNVNYETNKPLVSFDNISSKDENGNSSSLTPTGVEIKKDLYKATLKADFITESKNFYLPDTAEVSPTFALKSDLDNIYSEDETVVGTWIDGKPIYRITVDGSIDVSDGNETSILSIPDLKKVINSYGEININSVFYNVHRSAPTATQFIDRSVEDFYLYNTDPLEIGNFSIYNFTVEYTKTTD